MTCERHDFGPGNALEACHCGEKNDLVDAYAVSVATAYLLAPSDSVEEHVLWGLLVPYCESKKIDPRALVADVDKRFAEVPSYGVVGAKESVPS